jgi:osmoprotectant transport system ATP-binding protein
VLLMDEPFGAVDPITRVRLQDELISIQHDLQKTIVCVTHDFDEAVKLGDWIAIFTEGAQLIQYDTPERILAEPANEFVENFIGAGAGLKQLTLTRVNDVELSSAVTARPGTPASEVLTRLDERGHEHAVILDDRDRPLQWLSRRQLARLERIGPDRDEQLPLVGERATLNDALDIMLVSSVGAALVTGGRDSFRGVIDVATIMDAIGRARVNARDVGIGNRPVGINTSAMDVVRDAAGEGSPAAGSGEAGHGGR